METNISIRGDPFFEFVTRGNNPLTIFITELPKNCCLCNHKSNSLFILTFNQLACEGCFDFALGCNFFNPMTPINTNVHPNPRQFEDQEKIDMNEFFPFKNVVNF